MSLIHIVTDFIALGITGAFVTVTLLTWLSFLEITVYQQGYLKIIDKRPVVKAILNLSSGIVIWGYLLYRIHTLLWTTSFPGITGTVIAGG